MESVEEYPLAVVKGKRTKRRRQPASSPISSSSASSSESTTTEEEDMAHCLILLAQGHAAAVESSPPPPQQQPVLLPTPAPVKGERYTSRKYTEATATADGGKAGFYVYECKTCNKCFPSFQALGGHRASHKKPRLASAADDKKQSPPSALPPSPATSPADVVADAYGGMQQKLAVFSLNGAGNNKLRVHECSICGAEFASGQALGGHMRRHRPLNVPEAAATVIAVTEPKKERSLNLELDLNLPAPSDEESTSPPPPPPPPAKPSVPTFQFDGKQGLMLTASALVDCHN